MTNNTNFDQLYEPPTKEFIQNSLLFGLDSKDAATSGFQTAQFTGDSSSNNEMALGSTGYLQRSLIKLKSKIKRVVKKNSIFYEVALYVKYNILKKSIPDWEPKAPKLDLSNIMGLEVNDFIWRLYFLTLNRPPDNEGWNKFKLLLCSGATQEAVAYKICRSEEFADRAQVAHINHYRQAYWNYRLRDGLRRLPVIGWIIAAVSVPGRIYKLSVEERIRQADLSMHERQHYEALMDKINSQQTHINAFYSETNNKVGNLILQIKVLTSQIDGIQTQVEDLSADNKERFEKLFLQYEGKDFSVGIKELGSLISSIDNNLKIIQPALELANENITHANVKLDASMGSSDRTLSEVISALQTANQNIIHANVKLDASMGSSDRTLSEVVSALQVANQNIIHANVKLDESGSLITNTANRNKPIFYGFPGGVTVIQMKDFIMGVPSEEWRLAIFLSIYGRFEFGTEDFFVSILKEGMNVVDVGANLGIYTLHALASKCFVYSYEPTPRIFKILQDNIGINGFEPEGRATVYNLAVSDVEGAMKLAVYDNINGHNTFFPDNADDQTIEVKTVSLDHHLSHLEHIDVVKIDVEGAEQWVLKGMKRIILNNPEIKIIMEFAPVHIKRSGSDPSDFIREIRDMGLDIQLIDEETGKIRDISDDELCGVYSANVLLGRPSEGNTS
jgi:FkbM family methyltransferase